MKVNLVYMASKVYSWFVEDTIMPMFSEEKVMKVRDGARNDYLNEENPYWKRGFMKARMETANKHLSKKLKGFKCPECSSYATQEVKTSDTGERYFICTECEHTFMKELEKDEPKI